MSPSLPPINKRDPVNMKRLGYSHCPVCKGIGYYKRGCAGTGTCRYCNGGGWVSFEGKKK